MRRRNATSRPRCWLSPRPSTISTSIPSRICWLGGPTAMRRRSRTMPGSATPEWWIYCWRMGRMCALNRQGVPA